MIRVNRQWSLLVLGLVALSGCGGVYDSYVSGVVTLDGNALRGGTVAFVPEQTGPASYAGVLNDGTYVVNTGREEGLPTGTYTVTVVSREDSVADTSGRGLPPQAGKMLTPLWYTSTKNSPLKFTVEPGNNEINLELTSEPPVGWSPPGRPRR